MQMSWGHKYNVFQNVVKFCICWIAKLVNDDVYWFPISISDFNLIPTIPTATCVSLHYKLMFRLWPDFLLCRVSVSFNA